MKKLFVAVLALAALAACNKEEVNAPVLDTESKSVAINILNSYDGTRAEAGNTKPGTDGQLAVVEASELKILFADTDGVILMEKALVSTSKETTHPTTGEYVYGTQPTGTLNGDYIFHNVPAAVTQIAVVRYETGDFTVENGVSELATIEDLAKNQAENEDREMDDIILYSRSGLTKTDECTTELINGKTYYIYTAQVTVAPMFTRFEINNIECLDLGWLNDDNDPNTYAYDTMDLVSLGWGAAYGAEYPYTIDPDQLTTLTGAYDGTANATWENEAARACKLAEGKVWSWNVLPEGLLVPSATNPLVLKVKVAARDYTVAKEDLELKVVGLTKTEGATTADVTSFDVKNVYQLNLKFNESDLAGQEGKCVQVDVTIAPWSVKAVYPIFGN